MSDYKIWDVMVPVSGHMRVIVRAKDKDEAMKEGSKIANEMFKESSDTIIPNLFTWWLTEEVNPMTIERGEADE